MAAIILYEKVTGKATPFAHVIDAKESMRSGFYVTEDPTKKPKPIEKIETAPVKIPTFDKKPVEPEIVPKKGIIKKSSKIKK